MIVVASTQLLSQKLTDGSFAEACGHGPVDAAVGGGRLSIFASTHRIGISSDRPSACAHVPPRVRQNP
jgi:hypothetical protein